MNKLLDYWRQLDKRGRADLAEAIGTTPEGLRQLAHGYRSGGEVSASPEMAVAVEAGTRGAVLREDCCKACASCGLAKVARGRLG